MVTEKFDSFTQKPEHTPFTATFFKKKMFLLEKWSDFFLLVLESGCQSYYFIYKTQPPW